MLTHEYNHLETITIQRHYFFNMKINLIQEILSSKTHVRVTLKKNP